MPPWIVTNPSASGLPAFAPNGTTLSNVQAELNARVLTSDLPTLPGGAGVTGVVFLDVGESSAGLPDGTKVCRRYV